MNVRIVGGPLLMLFVNRLTGFAAENPQIQALSLSAEPARSAVEHIRPQAVYQQAFESVFPELILGGEWTSVIKLTNRSSKAIPTTHVYFVYNLGNSMKTTFQTSAGGGVTDVGFRFSLPPGRIIEATFLS